MAEYFNRNNTGQTSVSMPPHEIIKIQILERRANLIEALEFYKNRKAKGQTTPISLVTARLFSLFLEIRTSMKRKDSDNYYIIVSLLEGIEKRKIVDNQLHWIEEMIFRIEYYLDNIELTKIDTKEKHGTPEEENKAKGLS